MRIADFPALCVGLIVATYWARVIKLVIKTRRRSGRAANFLPPEKLGRLLRIIWYPTVAGWICVPFIVAFLHRSNPYIEPLFHEPALQWASVAIALVGLLVTLVCWKRMGSSWRMGIDPSEKTQLVVQGPWGYVRHPIYALSSLIMIASLVAVPSPLMLLIAAFHLTFLQWEARREERHLVATHGELYRDYYRHVGRFVPRSLAAYEPHG